MSVIPSRFDSTTILATLIALAGAVFLGVFIARFGFSFQMFIVVLMTAMGIASFFLGRRGIYVGYILWVFTFLIGYRTFPLTRFIKLHPSEIFLWALFIFFITQQVFLHLAKPDLRFPRWLYIFMLFWLWGWFLGLQTARPWDRMFSEFRNFLILIPAIMVTKLVLKEPRRWRFVFLAMFITGIWVAAWGIAEYLFPGIERLFPSFISETDLIMTGEGFARVAFSFWGSPIAALVCLIALPTAIALWELWPSLNSRIFFVAGVASLVFAIYLSGYRSFWIILSGVLVLWVIRRFGWVATPFILAPAVFVYSMMPTEFQQRTTTIVMALEGQPVDTSAVKRLDYAQSAIQLIQTRPQGVGWAGSGWPHNDFLQIAANLGLAAGVFFAVVVLVKLWQTWRKSQRYTISTPVGAIGYAVVLMFLVAVGLLASQGVQVLPQLVLPVWFAWGVMEAWIDLRVDNGASFVQP